MSVPILLLARELGQGGSERQLAMVAQKLDRSRFSPHVGVFRRGGMRLEEIERAGIPVVEFPVRSFKSLDAWRAGRQLRAYTRSRGIRLIHSFDAPLNLFGMFAGRLATECRLLASQRAFGDVVDPFERRFYEASLRVADGVVVNCEGVAAYVQGLGVAEGKIHLCYNGIDVERFSPGPRGEELARYGTVIGTVCALRPEKQIETLVEAFGRMRRPERTALLIVGSGGEREKLERIASERVQGSDVRFVPATADVTAWLQSIDLFVLPSRSEALSNSLLEAMACGCTPVASEVGGNRELIRDHVNGRLFPSGDAAALASVLEELLARPDLAREMAERSAERVREQFTIEASIGRMQQIYRRVLGEDK